MEMTIARAMKHRVRVASRLNRVSRDIQSQNSHMENNKPEVDVKALMEVRNALMIHLVDLRVAIDRASEPIKRDLFSLAEKKTEMVFLQQIETKDGKQPTSSWSVRGSGIESTIMTYKATYRKFEIDKMIIHLETTMDVLQENLDRHNATTKITIGLPEAFDHPHRK